MSEAMVTGAMLCAERGTSLLEFSDGETQEFFMRGAVCWPVLRPAVNVVQGCVMMAGQDVANGLVTVFEQHLFDCVDPFVDPETFKKSGTGCAGVMNRCWSSYLARRYFFNQADEVATGFFVQAIRSKTIIPKPDMVEAHWSDDAEVRARLRAWENRVDIPPGECIENQVAEFASSPGAPLLAFPAVWALGCLVTGLERWPWKKSGVARKVKF